MIINVEFAELLKALGAAATFLGTLAVWVHNRNQGKKIRADLLKEFDDAVQEKRRHRACEIFRLLWGIRLKYSDIEKLIENDDVARIVNALSKNPGMVRYENGQFEYTGLFEKKKMQNFNKVTGKLLNIIAWIMIALSTLGVIFTSGGAFGLSFVFLIGFTIALADNYKQAASDEMIEELIDGSRDR